MAVGSIRQEKAEIILPSLDIPAANWQWFLLRGLLYIALGVAALLFPLGAVFAFTLVFAAFAAVDGIFSIISGLRGAKRKQDRWWAYIVRGIIGVGAGTIFVLMPFVATVAYAYAVLLVLCAWAISTGALEIYAAIRFRKEIEREWLAALSGALSILLGLAIVVFIATNPAATMLSVGWIISLFAFAAGIALCLLAYRLKQHRSGANRPAETPQQA